MFTYLHFIFVNEREKFEGHCNMQISFFLQLFKDYKCNVQYWQKQSVKSYRITREGMDEEIIFKQGRIHDSISRVGWAGAGMHLKITTQF